VLASRRATPELFKDWLPRFEKRFRIDFQPMLDVALRYKVVERSSIRSHLQSAASIGAAMRARGTAFASLLGG